MRRNHHIQYFLLPISSRIHDTRVTTQLDEYIEDTQIDIPPHPGHNRAKLPPTPLISNILHTAQRATGRHQNHPDCPGPSGSADPSTSMSAAASSASTAWGGESECGYHQQAHLHARGVECTSVLIHPAGAQRTCTTQPHQKRAGAWRGTAASGTQTPTHPPTQPPTHPPTRSHLPSAPRLPAAQVLLHQLQQRLHVVVRQPLPAVLHHLRARASVCVLVRV
jgi:hypothetical protein